MNGELCKLQGTEGRAFNLPLSVESKIVFLFSGQICSSILRLAFQNIFVIFKIRSLFEFIDSPNELDSVVNHDK